LLFDKKQYENGKIYNISHIYTINMKNMNLRDLRILHELDRNPKASYNMIGRKLRLSPSVVERRIKNLIAQGIIKEFKTIENYKKLGWTYYSIYGKLQSIDESKKEALMQYFREHPLSGQILLCDGRWQLIFGFFAKDLFSLDKELKILEDKFGDFVRETEKIVHIGSHHYYRGYFLQKGEFREDEPFLGGPEKTINLDDFDIKILNDLRGNARTNLVDLSDKLGASLDKIRYGIEKLKENKVILGSWLHVNPEKLGIHFYRILLKMRNINEKTEQGFFDYLNGQKNVIRGNKIFGSWDYFVDLEISTEEFRDFRAGFIKKFSDYIQEYETVMIYDEVKYVFSPIFPLEKP
jgi:DNA-binding Lrp family transcriptional regulator